MIKRHPLPVPMRLPMLALFGLLAPSLAAAAIFEWEYVDPLNPNLGKQQSTTLTPDGAGANPAPNAILTNRNFTMAYLFGANLNRARFSSSNLTDAYLRQANLTAARMDNSILADADLRSANLTEAFLYGANLAGADFTNAIIAGANLGDSTSNGFTQAQFYSTASYQQHSLPGLEFGGVDTNLAGWDFTGQNLTDAQFSYATLTNADFTGAIVKNAAFQVVTDKGFTAAQLYSTASYQNHDLGRFDLAANNLAGWNFAGQMMAESQFHGANLAGANFDGANLAGASLFDATLTGASFVGANLAGIDFPYLQTLTNVNFTGANLTGADFSLSFPGNADITNAIIRGANISPFSTAALYSTASYQTGELQGIELHGTHPGLNLAGKNVSDADLGSTEMPGANFHSAIAQRLYASGSNLAGADFRQADLTGASLDADLQNARFDGATLVDAHFGDADLAGVTFDGATIRGARFLDVQPSSLSQAQLYSTASYQQHDLRGVDMRLDVSGWDFSGQDFTGANLRDSKFRNVDWTGANLTEVDFTFADLQGADLSAAILQDARFPVASVQNADLHGVDAQGVYFESASLAGANLAGADLREAVLQQANLSGADLSGADLRKAFLRSANFAGAVLTGADVRDANLDETIEEGLTFAQLYSTASYQMHDLAGVQLRDNNLTSINLAGQDLTRAYFNGSNLTNASLAGARLISTNLAGANVTDADFSGAELKGVAIPSSMTAAQLYSTDSYQQHTLMDLVFGFSNRSGWNFANQNLMGSSFAETTVAGADFTGAILRDTIFSRATTKGFTLPQLYSTASYQQHDLRGVKLNDNNLAGANFANQDLRRASLYNSDLTGANFTGALIQGVDFALTTPPKGFTAAMLYSTASYQNHDLRGVSLGGSNNFQGWDFFDQNFMGADLSRANMTGANFNRADLRGSTFGVFQSQLPTELRNAIHPDGSIHGLNLAAGERLLIRNFNLQYVTQNFGGRGGPPPNLPMPTAILLKQQVDLDAGGVLELVFDDAPWQSTMKFAPGAGVSLGGVLRLGFADGVDPANHFGRTFDVFDWTDVAPTGQFAIESPWPWDASRLYTTGEITLIPEPATCALATMAVLALAAIRRRSGTRCWSA